MFRSRDGFTLLELLIVVALIGIFVGFFLPSPSGMLPFRIRNASRIVVADLEYAAQRAAATGLAHRWVIDLDRQVFRLEQQGEIPSEEPWELPDHSDLLDLAPPRRAQEYLPVANLTGGWRSLDDPEVEIDEVRVGSEHIRAGSVGIGFAADGSAEPAEIWLMDENGLEMRLLIVAFTGEIHSEERSRGH